MRCYDGDMKSREDGLFNVFTRIGDLDRDKSANTSYIPGPTLTRYVIDALYEHEAIVARIIDRPADDLTREGFELADVDGVDVPRIMSELESVGRDGQAERPLLACISDLHRWGNKDGGALLCVAVDDGRLPIEPLDLSAIQRVAGFFVLERDDVTPVTVANGPPEAYVINTLADIPLETRTIHASRCVKFIGPTISQRRQRSMQWWGISEIQRVWIRLRQYLSSLKYGEALLHEMSLDVYFLKGLTDMLMQPDGEDLVLRRMVNLKLGQDILHGSVFDKDDDYRPVTKSAGSIPELLDRFVDALVMATGRPRAILLGETVGGLNSGENAGEIRSYYDSISVEQERLGTGWLNWCLEIVFAASEGPTGGKVPDEWTVEWRPLWQPTDKEQAEVRQINAATDSLMLNMGAAAAEEVRQTRMVQGSVGHLEPMEEFDDLEAALPEGEEPEGPEPEVEEPEETAAAGEPSEVPTVADSSTEVQKEALNGAQIASLLAIIENIRTGTLPMEVAIRVISVAFPGVLPSEADAAALLVGLDVEETPETTEPVVVEPEESVPGVETETE